MVTANKYTVRRGKTGTIVSQHRSLDAAERALMRYLRSVARKSDTPKVFTILNPVVTKHGAGVRVGFLFDEKGRERVNPWGGVFRAPTEMEKRYRSFGPKKRSTKKRSTKKNRRRSSRGRR